MPLISKSAGHDHAHYDHWLMYYLVMHKFILSFVCVQSFLKDMAAKKVMAIVQLPHSGKFLGLITASSSSSPAQVPQKLIGLVLTLHINQQPKQQ